MDGPDHGRVVLGSADRPEASPAAVIFDLDGVLTRRDTLTALVGRSARRRPWRLVRLIGPLVRLATQGGDLARRAGAVQRIVSVLFAAVDQDELDRWCASLGRRAASSRRWTRPDLVAEYRRLLDAGHPIVVATATEERVARAMLDAASLRADAVLGSRIVTAGGAAALAVYNYGPRKAQSLSEAGPPLVGAVFYTDSGSDLPTAAAVHRVVLVEPSRATRAVFRAAGVPHTVFGSSGRPGDGQEPAPPGREPP